MEDDYLQKVDLIRQRVKASYEEISMALENAGGNVVQALIALEREKGTMSRERLSEELQTASSKVVNKVKDIIDEGNKIQVKISKDDRTLVSLPATVGVLGAVLAPVPTLVGAAAALATKCSVKVERDSASSINLQNNMENS